MRYGIGLWCGLCVGCMGAADLHPPGSAKRDGGFEAADTGVPVKPSVLAPLAGRSAPMRTDAASLWPAAGSGTSAGSDAGVGLPQPSAGGEAAPLPTQRMMRAATPARVGQLVFTELMVDPESLSDAEGEWFELHNTTDVPLDLQGCSIDDGAKQPRAITGRLLVGPHGYLTIARQERPGFSASFVASFSLGNSADSLALRCGETEIDRVAYDVRQGFPIAKGASAALDPSRSDATANDDPAAWCLGTTSYGPELGTPGRPNPPCHRDDDAGVTGD